MNIHFKHAAIVVLLSTVIGCGAMSTPEQKGVRAIERLDGFVEMIDGHAFYVSLCETEVSDADLVHLKELTMLNILALDGTEVTDAGLEHIKGLTHLKELEIPKTRISDLGVQHL